MKRVIKFERGTINKSNEQKYVLAQEYEGFGVYEKVLPYGYIHYQSWLIANDKVALVCEPDNHFCKEELLDMIDYYKEKNCFGTRGFRKGFYSDLNVFVADQKYKTIV